MNLDALGSRIIIMGPSNSGKSTLANAIGAARNLATVHLDQLYHLPNTDWERRPGDEFIALHDQAIAAAGWVMEGNYTRCLPRRLERATGFILLDTSTATSLVRYLRRCWFARNRIGGLDGGKDSLKWEMFYHIVVTTRENRKRYDAMFDEIELAKIRLRSRREIDHFYRSHELSR